MRFKGTDPPERGNNDMKEATGEKTVFIYLSLINIARLPRLAQLSIDIYLFVFVG